MAERTLIIIKPEKVQRQLVDEKIGRFEKKYLKPIAAKFIQLSKKQVSGLYTVYRGNPFFKTLSNLLPSRPIVVMAWKGQGVIDMARKTVEATSGYYAEPGTIRGDISYSEGYNFVHILDSPPNLLSRKSSYFSKQMK